MSAALRLPSVGGPLRDGLRWRQWVAADALHSTTATARVAPITSTQAVVVGRSVDGIHAGPVGVVRPWFIAAPKQIGGRASAEAENTAARSQLDQLSGRL